MATCTSVTCLKTLHSTIEKEGLINLLPHSIKKMFDYHTERL